MRTKGIKYNGKLYEFSAKSVIIDGRVGITCKRDLINLLDEVVRSVGKDKHPNIDPVYFHLHSHNESFGFSLIARHVYQLMKETTVEYQLHKQAVELLTPPESFFHVSVYREGLRIVDISTSELGVIEVVNRVILECSDSFDVDIHITKSLPF